MFGLFKKKATDGGKLFFTTDVHSHVVPGIDDGSSSVELSLQLLERMKAWGIENVIATPHVTQDTFENTPEIVAEPFGLLCEQAQAKGLGLNLKHSAEYRLDEFSLTQLESGVVMPFPNNYLLVENSFYQEPWNLKQVFFDLMVKDFRLIWAHPERYTYYYDKAKRGAYEEYHNMGVLFQVNLLSLAGYYGKNQKKMAEELVEKGFVDFLGTDMHNLRHADAIDAYLQSKDYARHRKMLEGRILNDEAFI